jgi:chitin disaccharide deacetylase
VRRLVLCADDFAFSPEVSRTIAGLAAAGKLNATSCMTAQPGWPEDARRLADLPPAVAVGLHLTLTLEAPLTRMPLLAPAGALPPINALAKLARRGQLPLGEVAGEIAAQFDRFAAATGRPPAFVDAHQHALHLPGIRDLVLEETRRRAPAAWLRTCEERSAAMFARPWRGKAVRAARIARGFTADARRHELTTNHGFAGHYGFRGDWARLFPRFLDMPGRVHLVMCHPGAGRRPGDGIAAAREAEAEALARLPIADLAADAGLAF